MTETDLQVYEIPAENMPGLLHKLEGLSKKSKKILGKPIDLTVLRETRKPHLVINRLTGKQVQATDADGNLCWNIFYDVTIDAETPKIHGWSFIATIDHSTETSNIIRVSPNAKCEVPTKYRTVGPNCDHCKFDRRRRDTFLLRSDATGEFKQIGRQCIRDFIGYDVTQVVAMAEIVSHALPSDSDGDGDWSGGMGDRRYIMVKTYMAHVAAIIRTHGWISKKDAEFGRGWPTAGHAHTNMFPPRGRDARYDRVLLTDKDFETADAALEYGQALTGTSDFDHNLHTLAHQTMVENRSTGMLAYLIPAFFKAAQREFERVQRRAALKLGESRYVGKIGDKIGTTKNHQIAPFQAVLYGYHVMSGNYGPTHIYRFRSDDGNVFVWFASEGPAETLGLGGLDASKRVAVRIEGGSVKNYSEYDGVKHTRLTRCKVKVLEAADAA
jgi:hypothetical protein